nr:hypothetical protein [Tanacetum cinerariifolium]
KPATSKSKLKGASSLTLEEQEAADIMQALKERKKTSIRQPGIVGLNEGTGIKPGVLGESIVISATLSKGTGFGDQFLKLSFDSSLVSTVKDTTDLNINSLLEIKIQFDVPHTESPSMLSVTVSVISKPTILTPVQESHLIASMKTLPPLSVSTTPHVP